MKVRTYQAVTAALGYLLQVCHVKLEAIIEAINLVADVAIPTVMIVLGMR